MLLDTQSVDNINNPTSISNGEARIWQSAKSEEKNSIIWGGAWNLCNTVLMQQRITPFENQLKLSSHLTTIHAKQQLTMKRGNIYIDITPLWHFYQMNAYKNWWHFRMQHEHIYAK